MIPNKRKFLEGNFFMKNSAIHRKAEINGDHLYKFSQLILYITYALQVMNFIQKSCIKLRRNYIAYDELYYYVPILYVWYHLYLCNTIYNCLVPFITVQYHSYNQRDHSYNQRVLIFFVTDYISTYSLHG